MSAQAPAGAAGAFGRDQLEALVRAFPFPDPREAGADGLLAWGGDLSPERLLAGYAQGVFPWYERDPILWYSPDPRMLLRPGRLRVNRTLGKSLRRARYEVRVDTAFGAVIEACARVERPGQSGTWITREMRDAYCRLHQLGFAHSFEAFEGEDLVGGVYGLSLGAAFFGESMFATRSDASKVAFVHLVRQIEGWGFHFLDCQVYTQHSERLGAERCPRRDFLAALERALEPPTRRGPWRLEVAAAARAGGRP